jgi:aerobic carbon-monoxide dehydrogenase medium subunit
MYPAKFDYHAPKTLAEALALLEQHGDDAKCISGSMSLVPMMKLRLASPAHLVDLRKLPGMVGVWEQGGVLQIGALTTHRQVSENELLGKYFPMVSEAAGNIGDRQVRNMGTIGGSLAHADPAADYPAVTVALDASVQIVSKKGERAAKVEELIVGPLTTTLGPGEIIVQVRVPLPAKNSGSAYAKHPHPASRFAVVGVAASVTAAGGKVQSARIAVTGLGPKVSRASAAEKALVGGASAEEAAKQITEGIEVRDDLIGSAAYKRSLAAMYAARAIAKAIERAK